MTISIANKPEIDYDAIWQRLEDRGLVRIHWEPDFDPDLAVSECDKEGCCNNPGVKCKCVGLCKEHCDQCAREMQNNESEGVWGAISQFRLSRNPICHRCSWQHGDSIWGITGRPDDINGYADDLKRNCIEALRKALKGRVKI